MVKKWLLRWTILGQELAELLAEDKLGGIPCLVAWWQGPGQKESWRWKISLLGK